MKPMTIECLEPWPAAISGRPETRWRCNYCRMEGTQTELARTSCSAGASHPPPQDAMADAFTERRLRNVMKAIGADDFVNVRDYPSAVHVVAYDNLGRCQADETHPDGASAVRAFERFIGGTVTFLDAATGNKIWEVTRQ